MKFRAWIAILMILSAVSAWPAVAQKPVTVGGDFRGARWGQSPLEVLELEAKSPIFQDESLVIFHDEFEGTPTEVIYYFLDGRLIMGFTNLLVDHEDLNLFFDDYEQVKASVVKWFGAPRVENWQMSLPELEDDRSMWGEALGFGLLKVEAGWLVKKTGIAVRLSGTNFTGHLMTIHFSRDDMNAGRSAYKQYFAQNMGVPNRYFQN